MNSNIFADYGNIVVPAKELALQRGSGNFNPSPNFEQSTDRGPAYSQALNYYTNYQSNFKNINDEGSNNFGIYDTLDTERKYKYEVGSTNFHPETMESWNSSSKMKGVKMGTSGDNQYVTFAAKSLQIAPNALMNFFFSVDNIEYLQDLIVDEVLRSCGTRVSRQSIDSLLIIMRNNYVYAISGWLPRDPLIQVYPRGTIQNKNGLAYTTNGETGTSLSDQVIRLNQAVLEEAVKQVLSGIQEYKQYYKDASSLPMPLSHPVLSSQKGSKEISVPVGFDDSVHERNNAISSYNQRFNII